MVEELSHKIAGSIPAGTIGIFHLLNPLSRITVLRSTQPVTEMRTSNISLG
jgi:hypothetical protein